MSERFTKLHEADADAVAPRLARADVAAGVYLWLLSRAFSTGNEIKVSCGFIAESLRVSRRGVADAVKRLEACGAIRVKGKRGRGGGSVFSVVLPSLEPLNMQESVHLEPLNMQESVHLNEPKCAETRTLEPLKCTENVTTNIRKTAHNKDKEEDTREDNYYPAPDSRVSTIIERLNTLTGSGFDPISDGGPIAAALGAGLTDAAAIKAVEHCCAAFSGDYRRFLTPAVIFKPDKVGGYARAWSVGDREAAEQRAGLASLDYSAYD